MCFGVSSHRPLITQGSGIAVSSQATYLYPLSVRRVLSFIERCKSSINKRRNFGTTLPYNKLSKTFIRWSYQFNPSTLDVYCSLSRVSRLHCCHQPTSGQLFRPNACLSVSSNRLHPALSPYIQYCTVCSPLSCRHHVYTGICSTRYSFIALTDPLHFDQLDVPTVIKAVYHRYIIMHVYL